jgi:hypothetical protein
MLVLKLYSGLMNTEQLMERELTVETEVLGENLPQR